MTNAEVNAEPRGGEDTPPLISVVIPVKNGEATMRACLDGIFSQTLHDRLEVILIDSGSTDKTLEIANEYPVRVHRIPSREFSHGGTRNLGVQMARGELVALTVMDAVPVDDRWLERMASHFKDPEVAGVCGLQRTPSEKDKNPLQWFRPVDKVEARSVRFDGAEAFDRLAPKEQAGHCHWDDVNALYRRSALLETPFQPVSFAEDAIWARDALRKGYRLVYDPTAQVYHYHQNTFSFGFRRNYTILYHTYIHFGWRRPPSPLLRSLARVVYRMAREKGFTLGERVSWILYNMRGVFAGYLAARYFQGILLFRGLNGITLAHKRLCGTTPQPPRSLAPTRKGPNV